MSIQAKTLAILLLLATSSGCSSIGEKRGPSSRANTPAATPGADWRYYAGDPGSSKYSPLNQINKTNVRKARVVWRWAAPDNAILAANKNLSTMYNEATPIAIGGFLYTSTSLGLVVKIDGSSGRTVWTYDPETYRGQTPPNFGFVHRGLAYWESEDQAERRIYIGTGDAYLIALDADTGKPIESFGSGGRIDLLRGLARDGGDWKRRWQYGVSSPVTICRGTIIVGSSINDLIADDVNPPGDVRGFDVKTGALKWTFHTVPRLGEPGYETWKNGSAEKTGNTNAWAPISADLDLGLVYLPVGTPANDMYGGRREGEGLFGESLVCLDCITGKRQWHYQLTHHGLWDYDPPASPNLADIVVAGKPVKAVVQVTKQSFAYAFDRTTGKPIWPITERPVPQSTVENSSPTQPFPPSSLAFDRQGISEEDLIDFTPELRAEAKAIVDQYVSGPLFTPPSDQKKGTLVLPGSLGGASWAGAAFHPGKKKLFVASVTRPVVDLLVKEKKDGTDEVSYAYSLAGANITTPDGKSPDIPLFKPPYGRLTAIDLNAGKQVWQIPLGVGPRENPKIKPFLKGTPWESKDLGWERRGQLLVTEDLLFVGQTGSASVAGVSLVDEDGRKLINGLKVKITENAGEQNLKVFDPDTGELLHEINLLDKAALPNASGNAYGAPMTFLNRENKQVVVVPVGGANLPAELVAIQIAD